ncbi:DNA mismatch repair protein MutS [Chlamydiales bacterium STE3]|nr:DNA mismatch repair protein MutS [Chlamydiales bacterium STE3]
MNAMTKEEKAKTTPMMAQWYECKAAAKDAILFFRLGDFYEAFYDDAALIAKELDLTLTKRQDTPMSGVPYHTAETYIDRLVSKGYKVAVAEQTENPTGKGLVNREVKRFITPATNFSSSYLSEKSNTFFACVHQLGTLFGLAIADLTTGECYVIEFDDLKTLQSELYRLCPKELLISSKFKEKHPQFLEDLHTGLSCLVNSIPEWHFEHKLCYDFLTQHFNVLRLDGFGLKAMVTAINAAGALLSFLKETLCHCISHFTSISTYSSNQFMELDRATLNNLEILQSQNERSKKNTLVALLDQTITPMGGRALRRLLVQPLLDPLKIEQRHSAIEQFLYHYEAMEKMRTLLEGVRDLERLIMRINTGRASPKDILSLKFSLEPLPYLKNILSVFNHTLIQHENGKIKTLPSLVQLITESLNEEVPLRVSDGNVFRKGFCSELDELRVISQDSKLWMSNYQLHLRETSGIKTLKVGYTRVSGFYIEVSKGQAEKVPENFVRRQTLTNAERYITPELKEYEEKVFRSEEKIAQIESALFDELIRKISSYSQDILLSAQAIALLDFLLGLAKVARDKNYCKPIVDDGTSFDIKEGRHAIIESIHLEEKFIANDTFLDTENHRMMLITGPNMAGKSTYIRQVALIAIMAQIGSYVPAKYARIGIVDKLFTRIGASDDLSRGQSTFMVEMTETANILNNATSRSLVILDEIGRGTSTYDGISLAWSIAEYLLSIEGKKAKTLFATHYFELTKLEEKMSGVQNYSVAVHESGDQVLFLRKIVRGKADRSYGIHVARLAGLPRWVISRAKEILFHLEEGSKGNTTFEPPQHRKLSQQKAKYTANEFQLTFFNE